jgi:alpha-amylase/alpha-mannosidase (GH57 family)
MAGILKVAFLWHMHQPSYRDPDRNKYILPWVRLHGIKGYTDMLEAVRRFGGTGVTFNFSPCLLKQISDLTVGGQTDLYYDLSMKSPEELEPVEKKIILHHFFAANWETMVLRYPRYRDLLYRRGRHVSENELDAALRRFSDQDFLDLQVWFNLTWFGWSAEEKYALIPTLKRQGRDFTPENKSQLLQLQSEVIGRIIPEYRAAWQEGSLEIAVSPYYHPILPLLLDSSAARISQPHDPMPQTEFKYPHEAAEQLRRARDYAHELFGQKPIGLWPSEGAVSPAACRLAHEAGFEWLATDEAVLLATLKNRPREEIIYENYRLFPDGPAIFFRDRHLSDAIGFRYARNNPRHSVDDFLGHLENIAQHRTNPDRSVASIILDGENAWEYFLDGGRGFFEQLYGRLSQQSSLKLMTLGAYNQQYPASEVLSPIFPASWINGSFRIWIGDPVKNLAWEILKRSADVVEEYSRKETNGEAILRAREYLLTAEGSDWFWWYGEPNNSDFDMEFDQLFRLNQIQIYKELGLPIPVELTQPLQITRIDEELPLFPMEPVIDGRETNYYEWVGARVFRDSDYTGAMFLTTALVKRIYYGISPTHLYLRLDPSDNLRAMKNTKILVRFIGEGQSMLEITNFHKRGKMKATWIRGDMVREIRDAAYHKILEVAIPFEFLPRVENEAHFAIIIMKDNLEIERWPRIGSLACPWPTAEYLTGNWVV